MSAIHPVDIVLGMAYVTMSLGSVQLDVRIIGKDQHVTVGCHWTLYTLTMYPMEISKRRLYTLLVVKTTKSGRSFECDCINGGPLTKKISHETDPTCSMLLPPCLVLSKSV